MLYMSKLFNYKMKKQSLYFQFGKLVHPRVFQVLNRSNSPITPEINTRDKLQPSNGLLTRVSRSNLNANQLNDNNS